MSNKDNMSNTDTTTSNTDDTTHVTPAPKAKAAKAAKPVKDLKPKAAETKAAKPKAAKPAKPAPEASGPSPSAASEGEGTPKFEYEFLPVPGNEEVGVINPKEIMISRFDVRSKPAPVTAEFIASIKERMIQAPVVTYARDKATGAEGYLIVAGRRRRLAAIQAGLKQIKVAVIPVASFKEYLLIAGKENLDRQDMSAWDEACYIAQLKEAGMSPSEIKQHLHVTDGFITHRGYVFKLDERVQKLLRTDKFGDHAITKVRHLYRLSDDMEHQVEVATRVVEEGWTPKKLEEYVEGFLAGADEEDETPKKGGGEATTRKPRQPERVEPKDVKPVAKADLVALINFVQARTARLKAKANTKPETISFEKGRAQGLMEAAGLVELPNIPEEEEEA